MSTYETITIILGGLSTLAIFSFLVKENFIYRFFEHFYIGISAGLGIVLTFRDFLWPKVLEPMLGFDIQVYPDGTTSHPYNPALLWFLLPMVFGLFFYLSYSKRYAWLSKVVIGFTLGMSAGISFKGFFNEMIPQIVSSFKPLVVLTSGEFDLWASVTNIVFITSLLTVMYYFFFSFERKGVVVDRVAVSGRWFLMVCFGAFFGSTVMARMALLVERLQFLLSDWRIAILSLFQ